MITLIDLLEIEQIKTGSDDLFALLRGATIDERLDKDVLFNKILVVLGNCTPLFDTTITFKVFYNNFFKERARNISELLDTLEYDYNPIWNKDGKIRREHKFDVARVNDYKDEHDNTNKEIHNLTKVETRDLTLIDDGNSEHKVSADNASDYQPESYNGDYNKREDDGTVTNTDTGDLTTTDVGHTTHSTIKNSDHDEGYEETVEQGNIGVTSTQSLILEQREVVQFNIYQWVVDELKKSLFLLVY